MAHFAPLFPVPGRGAARKVPRLRRLGMKADGRQLPQSIHKIQKLPLSRLTASV
jgi:hypothetical protein